MSEATRIPTPGSSGGVQAPTDPLAALRDIHLPPAVDAWPPAPGWWLLGLAVTALLVTGVVLLVRHWRAERYRRIALAELHTLQASWQEHQDDLAFVAGISLLLKRVALSVWPRADVAGLTGEAWVMFLDDTVQTHEFSMGPGQVLIHGPYQRNIQADPALPALVERWIRGHRSDRYAPGTAGTADPRPETIHA